MLISNKHHFIFIHVPKNAGTSIHNTLVNFSNLACRYQNTQKLYYLKRFLGNNALLSVFDIHIPSFELKSVLGSKWKNYRSFAVCRNPYDRAVSRYFYFKNKPELLEHRRYEHINSFKEHVSEMGDNTWNDLQSYYLEIDNQIGVDNLLRFEDLENDWKKLTQEYNLDVRALGLKNKSPRSSEYLKYYDNETLQKINTIYKRDFELLGYKMINKIP
jgi:sulfotransferase famil protein